MKTNTSCRVAPCDQSVTERPRYYARQLITPDDLTLEQEYFRSKLRTHNRMMHGWGVVCGALVCMVPKAASSKNGNGSTRNGNGSANEDKFEPWQVMVQPGYILGPYGDEINLDCTRIVDLRTEGVTGVTGEACVEAIDPWCSEVFEQKDADHLYIAVRYQEVATRPVRVQPIGCGCDDTRCESSRLRDGYEIAVLDYCPDVHTDAPKLEDLGEGSIPVCPPCPEEPWVVLAEVTLGANGKITKIDNCACRRLVISFGNFWWTCSEDSGDTDTDHVPGKIKITKLSTDTLFEGLPNQLVTIVGENLDLVEAITFGDDLKLNFIKPEPTKLEGTVSTPKGTKPGPRPMMVTAKEASQSFKVENAVTVKASAEPKPAPPESDSTKGVKPGKRGKNEG
jgi:hypothetical protein